MTGKKAENLTLLLENGFPVPEFRVIPNEQRNTPEQWKTVFPWEYSAVRSSADVEDGAEQSFAGQFDTFLNVGRAALKEKIAACFASAEKKAVAAYQKGSRKIRMHVIVQKMVPAELSGVIFSSNPQGLLNESVIVCGRGPGEGVVSGTTETSSYYYHRTDRVYYREGREALLEKDRVEELVALSERICALLGEGMDIEFAIAGGSVFILQARRITTLDFSAPLIMDNSNIVESYPGISLPLTCSFVKKVYAGVFRGLSARVLKNERVLQRHEETFRNMVGSVNGRMYYKISNWYTAIRFLPLNRKLIPVWQEMMGVRSREYDSRAVKLPLLLRLGTYFNAAYELLTVQRHMEELGAAFKEVKTLYRERFDPGMSAAELASLYRLLQERLFAVWDVTLLNDLYAFIFTGLLKRRLQKRYGDAEEKLHRYISGISDIESLRPLKALTALALCWLENGGGRGALESVEYRSAFQSYLEEYGDRSMEELKLESRTFRSDPELLQQKVEEYAAAPERLRELHTRLHGARRTAPRGEGFLTALLAEKCAKGIRSRETARLNRSRIYGMVKGIFLALGERFAEEGLLEGKEEIFWLEEAEVFALAERKAPLTGSETLRTEYRGRIEVKKERWRLYEKLPAYSRLIFEKEEFDKVHRSVNAESFFRSENNRLYGTPCAAGIAEGEALVVTDVNRPGDVRGKILITKMTDPGWVFLLMLAKGVVSERGSLLSHTAIISRELKLPSVVGVKGITEKIRNGDRIRMNGSTGELEVMKSDAAGSER